MRKSILTAMLALPLAVASCKTEKADDDVPFARIRSDQILCVCEVNGKRIEREYQRFDLPFEVVLTASETSKTFTISYPGDYGVELIPESRNPDFKYEVRKY